MALAIAGAVTNIPEVRDSAYATMPFNARVRIGLVADVDLVLATVQTGSDVVAEEQEISDINRFPIFPDDFNIEDIAARGQRLRVGLRNTNAAAAVVKFAIRIDPLGL
ncbi:MAG: hypothetical protein V3T14_00140 [Myxococcota bacterium]